MNPDVSQRCANHPDRAGFAVCMSCRRTICQECATTWDGVNHCRSCLETKGVAGTARSGAQAWILWAAAVVALLFVTARAMAWSVSVLVGRE